jgi:beta-glucanase (GH16 family)
LIWQDEFDGKKLNAEQWIYRNLGPRRDGINSKDAVSLDGEGHLVISTFKKDDKYYTGMIGTQSKFEHKFGYWEAKIRFQKEVGHWSAFWLQSPEMGKIGDVKKYGTEIDIIEYLSIKGDTVLNNLHWDGYKEDHKHIGNKSVFPGLGKGFHTIGLWWTENEYRFYIDDEEMWRTTEAVSHRSQFIILSLEVGKWAGDIAKANLPDSMIVDYVRIYSSRP